MSRWRSLFTQFGNRWRSIEAHETLVLAYRAVFTGSPSREQQEIVLTDLLAKSGFNQVSVGVSTEELWRREGRRSLYAEIFNYLSLSDADVDALIKEARKQSALSELTS